MRRLSGQHGERSMIGASSIPTSSCALSAQCPGMTKVFSAARYVQKENDNRRHKYETVKAATKLQNEELQQDYAKRHADAIKHNQQAEAQAQKFFEVPCLVHFPEHWFSDLLVGVKCWRFEQGLLWCCRSR